MEDKVAKCRAGTDPSRKIPDTEMALALHAAYTCDIAMLADADFMIVAVPAPVDGAHISNFGPLLGASRTIGPHLKQGATVIYESTVCPGATEEICIPALECASGQKCQRDVNISLINELAIIFDKTGIDTCEVFEAARTNWNFLKFRPGLVGGHRIGVIRTT